MASDAHAMLRSRDFGSSGSSEEGGEEEAQYRRHVLQHQQQQHGNEEQQGYDYGDESINDITDPTTAMRRDSSSQDITSQSYLGHQTAANLASFEESFIPPEQPPSPGQAGETRPRPKTPSTKELQAGSNRGRITVSDPAGFTRLDGPRDIFANRDEGLVDLSQHEENGRQQNSRTSSRQQQRRKNGVAPVNANEDEDDESGNGTSGLNDQPSFERSESQSMRAETVNTRRGGRTTNAKDTETARSVKAGSKQQLTLREQEKVCCQALFL